MNIMLLFAVIGVLASMSATAVVVSWAGWQSNITTVSGQIAGSASAVDDNIVASAASKVLPEPATWSILIAGLGLIAADARRRRMGGAA